MKKIIALLLSVVLLCGMVLTAPMVMAEDAATETTPVVSAAKQINFVGNAVKYYPQSTFAQFGENLWSDPTVGDFAADGTYNTNGWWNKKTLDGQTAFMWVSPNERGHLKNDPTLSHTADGSGAIVIGKDIGNYTYRLPALEKNAKYVVTYWIYKPAASMPGTTYVMFGHNSPEYAAQGISNYPAGWTQQILLIDTNDMCFYNSNKSKYENFAGNVFLKFYPGADCTGMRWDDFACYKVSDEMEATFDEAWTNNAFTVDESLTATKEVVLTSAVGNYANVLASKSPNLFGDPTVSLFDEDGRYLQYYDETLETNAQKTTVINKNAWWDIPSDNYQYVGEYIGKGNDRRLYCGMDINGQVINDPTLSRTNDGSGVLQLKRTVAQYVKLPKMDAYSYYLVTFYVKGVAADNTWAAFGVTYSGTGKPESQPGLSVNHTKWFEVNRVIYTGSSARNPFMYTYGKGYYLDDFFCCKLTDAEGAAAMENKALTITDEEKTTVVTDTYGGSGGGHKAPINTAKLGKNLILDGTVANFDGEGNYSSYFAEEGKVISESTVADASAWWDKPVNDTQYNQWVGGGSSKDYQGMKRNNKLSNDPFESHTLDGSGVIKVTKGGQNNFALAKMESYSYYYVSFWVYNCHWLQSKIFRTAGGDSEILATIINRNAGQNAWRRVSFVIYTGANEYAQPYINAYVDGVSEENVVYFDDFEQYKLDFDYAAKVIAAGNLVDNGVDFEYELPGDIDNDGTYTATDLAYLKMIILGLGINDNTVIVPAEGKTKATIVDLVALKRVLALYE